MAQTVTKSQPNRASLGCGKAENVLPKISLDIPFVKYIITGCCAQTPHLNQLCLSDDLSKKSKIN